MFVPYLDYDVELYFEGNGHSYHGGSISPWMESLPSSGRRIGFVREPESSEESETSGSSLDSGLLSSEEYPLTDPSWMLL